MLIQIYVAYGATKLQIYLQHIGEQKDILLMIQNNYTY